MFIIEQNKKKVMKINLINPIDVIHVEKKSYLHQDITLSFRCVK